MSAFLIVWRDKSGATLSTYARPGSRTPVAQPEPEATRLVTAEQLRDLVAGRDPFDPVYVTTTDAEVVLGWKVETQ